MEKRETTLEQRVTAQPHFTRLCFLRVVVVVTLALFVVIADNTIRHTSKLFSREPLYVVAMTSPGKGKWGQFLYSD